METDPRLYDKKARFLEPNEQFNICRDKEDNKFLDAVYTSKADYLITLDKDLLDLRNENKSSKLGNTSLRFETKRAFEANRLIR